MDAEIQSQERELRALKSTQATVGSELDMKQTISDTITMHFAPPTIGQPVYKDVYFKMSAGYHIVSIDLFGNVTARDEGGSYGVEPSVQYSWWCYPQDGSGTIHIRFIFNTSIRSHIEFVGDVYFRLIAVGDEAGEFL